MRSRHLGVLTTVLHRALLDRDYPCAERAFGCLLRSKDVDVRRVWCIGLDLLLHRSGESGVRDAIEFLERLALFFPFRTRIHAQHPALVGEKKKRKQGERRKVPPIGAVEFHPALFSLLVEASAWRDIEAGPIPGAGARLETTRPEKVRERLEELMMTPPWSDMAALVCMRGMVCLWLADLELQKGMDRDGDEDMGAGFGSGKENRRRAADLRAEARGFFKVVREKGGTVPEGIEDAMAAEEEGDDDEDMADV